MKNYFQLIALVAMVSCAPRTQPNSNCCSAADGGSDIEFATAITPGDEHIKLEKVGRMWYMKATSGDAERAIEVPCTFMGCGTIYELVMRTRHINDIDLKFSKPDTIYLSQVDTLRCTIPANSLLKIALTPKKCANGIAVKVATPELADDVEVCYPNGENPLRDALQPVPESAIFAMEGYGLWDPSIVEVDGTYHLFCSRWANDKTWPDSEVIRATAPSLFGPYTFQEVVATAADLPWADRGVHNPKVMKVGDRFLLYFIGISHHRRAPGSIDRQTGFAFADKIDGEWTIINRAIMPANNPAIVQHEDGSVYAVGKIPRYASDCLDGFNDVVMRAYGADSLLGEYRVLGDDGNRLPGELELEDPAIQYINGRYHLLCTDWQGEATGVQKAFVYYISDDGVKYKLYSQTSIWDQCDTIPMVGSAPRFCSQIERPEFFIDDNGELKALIAGLISRPGDPNGFSNNFIMIRPVENFRFE